MLTDKSEASAHWARDIADLAEVQFTFPANHMAAGHNGFHGRLGRVANRTKRQGLLDRDSLVVHVLHQVVVPTLLQSTWLHRVFEP